MDFFSQYKELFFNDNQVWVGGYCDGKDFGSDYCAFIFNFIFLGCVRVELIWLLVNEIMPDMVPKIAGQIVVRLGLVLVQVQIQSEGEIFDLRLESGILDLEFSPDASYIRQT